MDKEKLYEELDKADELTDQEKREIYLDIIENEESEQQWQDEQSGF